MCVIGCEVGEIDLGKLERFWKVYILGVFGERGDYVNFIIYKVDYLEFVMY